MKEFTKLTEKEKIMVLNWRNHPEISRFMINKKIGIKEHFRFIESLKKDKSKKYFLVNDIGVVYFNDIKNDMAVVGLYKNPDKNKVGKKLMEKLIDYGFNELRLKRLILYVFEDNTKAINLYKKFNFKKIKQLNNLIKMELINNL
jgi:UDP-4-amino-4,6-dideoxy-N-acetyl-beta-L-altrosamine N-acetyltransferase